MNTPLALPAQARPQSELNRLGAELLTTLAGIAAAICVVALNAGLERGLDLDLLGLTYYFILPCGAILGGIGAAAGYYVAARVTSTLPSRRMLLEMLGIALSTWLLMHWVEYVTMRFSNGTLVRDAVSFPDYLRLRTEHLRLTIGGSQRPGDTTSELGRLGYAHELLQVLGFLAGGYVVWLALKMREACARCSRYVRTRRLLQRAPSALFDQILARANIALPAFADEVTAMLGNRRLVGLTLHMATCPSCRQRWLRPGVVMMDRSSYPMFRALGRYDINASQAEALERLTSEG